MKGQAAGIAQNTSLMTSSETAFSLFEGMDFDQSYDRGQKRQKTDAD